MIKRYKSTTDISINVVIKESKKNLHISFTAQSDGSSYFITDNQAIQYAIEHHYQYGKKFKLDTTYNVETKSNTKSNKNDSTSSEGENIQTIMVADTSEARDILADRFGVSRTKLRGDESIAKAAKAHNIQFEYK